MPVNLYQAVAKQGAKEPDLRLQFDARRRDPAGRRAGHGLADQERAGQEGDLRLHRADPRLAKADLSEYYEKGRIEAELVPQGTLAERMRAAGAGIPAFYTPAAVGTELAEGRETRVFNGREYLLEEALPLDYAFIRAYQADAFGNLRFRRAQRNFNPLMAMAAKVTIVEVEEDILPVGAIDPDDVHRRASSCTASSRCRRRPKAGGRSAQGASDDEREGERP